MRNKTLPQRRSGKRPRLPAAAVIGAALFLAIAAAPSTADAYPTGHKTGEHTLEDLSASAQVGVWRIEQGNLIAYDGPQSARNYLLLHNAEADVVRVTLQADNDVDMALLFRVQDVRAEPVLRFSGYGLFIRQNTGGGRGQMGFIRYDSGIARAPNVYTDIPDLSDERGLELLLVTQGAYFSAQLYRPGDKRALGAVAWSDASYAAQDARLGLYAYRKSAPFQASMSRPRAAQRMPAERSPLGAEWSVTLPIGTKLPSGPFRSVRGVPGDALHVITNEIGAQILTDAHTPTLNMRPGVAHAWRTPELYRRKAQTPTVTRRGLTAVPGLKDPAMVAQHMRALAEAYPERARLEEIGKSHEGRSIWALHIADDVDDEVRPRMLLCAAHHALEAITPEFPLDAAYYLLNPHRGRADKKRVAKLLAGFHTVIVPLVNVDGSHAFWHLDERYGRKNRRPAAHRDDAGVDLNRNYPFRWNNVEDGLNSANPASAFYRGPSAGSEPEVQAMMALAERERFVGLVSFHSAATKILVPYTVEGAANEAPAVAWEIAETLVKRLPHRFGRRTYEAKRNLYPVGGVDQDWYMYTYGTMAYLVEVPWSRPSLQRIAESVRHTRPAWQVLMERYLRGPSLQVVVTDVAGRPVRAAVSLPDITFENGETFSTHPKTGRFFRYLSKTHKEITVVVTTDAGRATQTVAVARNKPTTVTFTVGAATPSAGTPPADEPAAN